MTDAMEGFRPDVGRLRNHRGTRYRGDGQDIEMADLTPQDRERVEWIYRLVDSVYLTWKENPADPPWAEVREAALRLAAEDVRDEASALGTESRAARPEDTRLAQALHDIRGGGLTPALLAAMLLADDDDPALLHEVVTLCRDHAKMMRNAVRDLDPSGRSRDEVERPHRVEGLVRTWNGRTHRVDGVAVRVQAESRWDGAFSSCCLEVSAVDRVLYNLVNNAARFATDGAVRLTFTQADEETGLAVVSNKVDSDQRQWLEARLATDPGALFRAGVTRGGEGLGLANVASFVAAAFGVEAPSAAVDAGYVGGALEGERYHAWFHWPAYG